jgi:acyl-CoA:acyl-CoA alkyltransferase
MTQFKNVAIHSLSYVLPDEVLSSQQIEEKLAPTYQRLKLPEGRLELMTGIKERRMWPTGTLPSKASALAGEKVLRESGIDKNQIEVMMHSAVSRDFLEPATASVVHKQLGLSNHCQIFDVSNACLGFLNSFTILAAMIDSGQIKYGLVVAGENGRPLVEKTIDGLLDPTHTRKSIKSQIASLTIGCGSAAAILCHKSLAPQAPQLIGGEVMTASEFSDLCEGDTSSDARLTMATDSEKLMNEGVGLAFKTHEVFGEKFPAWSDTECDKYIGHQVGLAHRKLLFEKLNLNIDKDYSTFESLGNIGSVSLPVTLAKARENEIVKKGDRVTLMGIGSGINCMFMALQC